GADARAQSSADALAVVERYAGAQNLAVVIAGMDIGQRRLRLEEHAALAVDAVTRIEDHTHRGEIALEVIAEPVAQVAGVADLAEVRLQRGICEEATI